MGNEEQQNYRTEGKIGNNPDSLAPDQMKIGLFQMENCVCKIKINKITGTGFFCLIPFPNRFNSFPVLITCNHILNKDNISKGKEIKFSLNNEEISKSIIVDDSRKTYTDIKMDITLIEIKPEEDNIKFESFLNIDENIYNENPNDTYRNKTAYIIHYEDGKRVKYSVGNIKSIGEDKYTINHLCTTEQGSSGGPIINLLNLRVMGIHKGEKKLNLGTLLKPVIDDFNAIQKRKKLEIHKKDNVNENKKKVYSNIIYYDEDTELNALYKRCDYFERNINGTFILCDDINSFEFIKKDICLQISKDKRIYFSIIVNANYCIKIIEFLKEEPFFEKNIKNIFVYCDDLNEYINLKEQYPIVFGIYDNMDDFINDINKLASTEKIFSL